jgi:hypothetical protein
MRYGLILLAHFFVFSATLAVHATACSDELKLLRAWAIENVPGSSLDAYYHRILGIRNALDRHSRMVDRATEGIQALKPQTTWRKRLFGSETDKPAIARVRILKKIKKKRMNAMQGQRHLESTAREDWNDEFSRISSEWAQTDGARFRAPFWLESDKQLEEIERLSLDSKNSFQIADALDGAPFPTPGMEIAFGVFKKQGAAQSEKARNLAVLFSEDMTLLAERLGELEDAPVEVEILKEISFELASMKIQPITYGAGYAWSLNRNRQILEQVRRVIRSLLPQTSTPTDPGIEIRSDRSTRP